ncbi:MAG: glycerophosphodiester phosphodiesterase family protein, partial [Spirochaetota bacterium]
LWLLWPARPHDAMGALLKGRKFAHRGLFDNNSDAPENSLKAFRAAVDKGYGIELDIHLTSDGEIVVFHDDTLIRMCGVPKPVASLSLPEIKEQRLLGTEERIPAFDEFLAMVDARVPLLVEFKTGLPGNSDVAPLCAKAMGALDGYGGAYLIESFDANVLAWFRKHRPAVMRGQLALGFATYERALGKMAAKSIPLHRRRMLSWLLYNFRSRPHFISYRFEDAGLALRLCWALGAMVSVWTVRTPEDSALLLEEYDAVIFEGFLA